MNCGGTGPENTDSFTVPQIKGTKSSEYVFNKVVGMGSITQLYVGRITFISLRKEKKNLRHWLKFIKFTANKRSEVWEYHQRVAYVRTLQLN